MLQYPSIQGWKSAVKGKPCLAFYKYDGSNLRFEWSPKKGWTKFGTRTQLFDEGTDLYKQALPLFFERFGDSIVNRVNKFYGRKVERITAFAEFYGESSFAGTHELDEAKELKLFDVSVFKKGFMDAKTFIDVFGDLDHTAEVVYMGNMNNTFIEDVQYNRLNTTLNEGVICKGDGWSAKIKTIEYLDKLKNCLGKDWVNYAE